MNQDLVETLVRARRNRPKWEGVPASQRLTTLEEGYRLQAAVHARLAEMGVRRVGYKVGSTSAAGQERFGLVEPVYAGIFKETQFDTLFDALSVNLVAPSIECEIAVVLGADIDGSNGALAAADIISAISTCHLACEIVDNRYGDALAVGVPTLLGDDFFYAGFVLGKENPNWKLLDLSNLDARATIDGDVFIGNSSEVLSVIDSLMWLARKLAATDRRLRVGEIVMTGAIIPPKPVKLPPKELTLEVQGFEPLHLHGD